jgi:hypothetical protein
MQYEGDVMTAMQSRLLGAALLVAAVALAIHVIRSSDLSDARASQEAAERQAEAVAAQSRARLDAGPHIVSSKP